MKNTSTALQNAGKRFAIPTYQSSYELYSILEDFRIIKTHTDTIEIDVAS